MHEKNEILSLHVVWSVLDFSGLHTKAVPESITIAETLVLKVGTSTFHFSDQVKYFCTHSPFFPV